jgi:PAS domain S-box-containing protein
MPPKSNILNKQSPDLVDKEGMPASLFNRPVLFGFLVFVILISLFMLLIFQRYQLAKKSREKEAFEILHQVKEKLQESINHSLSATKILAFLIDKNGEVNNFDSIAAQVLETGKDIDAIQLVPGGIIQYVYPLKGNEKVIGYNILQDSARNKEAYKAIKQKSMFFAGPFELRQGGVGVVGRLPVYRQNKFWGFSAVVIKMSTLYATAGIDSSGNNGYYFQLSKANPDSKKEEFFLPRHKELSGNQSVAVDVPNGEWKLSVTSAVTISTFGDIGLLALFGFLLAVLAAVFAYRFAIRPKKLKELVLNRTSELRASENNYRSLIERVSDAFVALDNNWMYTYVNEKAGEILGREPQSLLGKNIWKEFPQGVDEPYYHAYYRAMKTQEYQYLEEYYAAFDKWLENHIYPSKDGLTIFFKDVTEIKQITLALKNKEEKYRTLIEQASDGIVITDMEGMILEVNKSIQQMVGYADDEMIGYHLTDFLPAEDVENNPLRIHELMQGKSLLYERRLKKKDGSFLDVEVNSKMASSHTLIGFIRDSTERKKYENSLIYQANLLESVSDAVLSLDMNRCIASWNNACKELYGFTADEAMGKRIPELVTFEYPNNNNEAVFKQVFVEGKWKGEFNFMHPKTKEKINLLSNINLLKDKKGTVSGFIVTSKNITDRIKREEEIRISNERFELIAQATNDAVWDHDFVKNETWGNFKLYTIYGFEPGSKKINLEMFMDHVHPDERDQIAKRMRDTIEKGAVSLSEVFRFRTAGGEYRTFYDRAYIKYDERGKPIRILGAMQDITEREQAQKTIFESEEKYRTIIEQAADGIFIADEYTCLIDVNSAGCRMSGYTKAELQQLKFIDVIPAEDIVTNPLRITKMEKGQSVTNERRLIRKDGSIIDVDISAQKLQDGRYQLFVRDITERKKVEEILAESERILKETQVIANLGTYTLDIATGKWTGTALLDQILGIDADFEKTFEGGQMIIHPDWRKIMADYFAELVAGRKSRFDIEYKIIRPNDNEERWIHGIGNLKYDDTFQPVTLLATIQDIHESKLAADELLQSEKKYRLLFYNNPSPMWMSDWPGMNIIDVNEAAIKHYGYSRQEFLKLNLRDLRPAEDLPYFNEVIKNTDLSVTNKRQWRHKKKDGTIMQVEVTSHEIMYEGQQVWLSSPHDVTDKNMAEERLQKSYQDIRQLASNLQSIREDERTNIAREIHDELGQQLTGLKMDIHWLSRKINSADEDITKKMKQSLELINATIASVRKIATDLRPSILDDLGLIAALEWQGEEFEKRSGTRVQFNNKAGAVSLKPEAITAVFRIYQELLTNVARHANATLVSVIVQKEDNRLFFSLTDNGTGFNLETINKKKTLGLLGIKERTLLLGGTYEFKSNQGEGSETIISIPLMQG